MHRSIMSCSMGLPAWACKDAEAVRSSHLPQVQGCTQQAGLRNSWAVPPSFWRYLSCRGLGHGVVVTNLCCVLVHQRVCLVRALCPKFLTCRQADTLADQHHCLPVSGICSGSRPVS